LQHVFGVPGIARYPVSRREHQTVVRPKIPLKLVRNRDCRFLQYAKQVTPPLGSLSPVKTWDRVVYYSGRKRILALRARRWSRLRCVLPGARSIATQILPDSPQAPEKRAICDAVKNCHLGSRGGHSGFDFFLEAGQRLHGSSCNQSACFPEAHRLNEHGKFLMMSPGMDRSGTLGFRCVADAR
jgi:hypothetical protein